MKEAIKSHAVLLAMLFVFVFVTGCQSMQGALNRTKEIFGAEKRDIMVAEVKDAGSSLEEVKARFQSAAEKFRTVLTSTEGKVDEKDKVLKSEYEKASEKAADIQDSIDNVTRAAESLFTEWEEQLGQYTSANLRSISEQRKQVAMNQTMQFIDAMSVANKKAGPVLAAFSDLVLFSRHELNAQSLESLNSELASVDKKLDAFIREIDLSIDQADALIKLMVGNEMKVDEAAGSLDAGQEE